MKVLVCQKYSNILIQAPVGQNLSKQVAWIVMATEITIKSDYDLLCIQKVRI